VRLQLTDLSVRSLKPEPGKQLKVWDTRTRGFGIRVNDNSKSWFVVYGRKRTLKILGRYPDDLSLQDARRKALTVLGGRPEPTKAPTYPDARTLYLEALNVSPRHHYITTRLLKVHFPWTGPIDKITHREVAEAIDAIPAKSEALHAFKAIRTFFNWCVPRYIPYSPAQGIKPPQKYVPRSRILTDDELRAVWTAADKVPYPFGTITKLLLLTGQRKSEIGELKWSYINGDTITLPQNKSGVPHLIYLCPTAQSLIAAIPRTSSPYLFPNSRDHKKPYAGYGFHKNELDKLSNVRGATIHDWRRTVASNLQKLGIKLEVTEAILGHTSGSVSGIVRVYQTHDYAEEKKLALQSWEARLKALLTAPTNS